MTKIPLFLPSGRRAAVIVLAALALAGLLVHRRPVAAGRESPR